MGSKVDCIVSVDKLTIVLFKYMMGQKSFDSMETISEWLVVGFRVSATAQDGRNPAAQAEAGGGGAESRVWH